MVALKTTDRTRTILQCWCFQKTW